MTHTGLVIPWQLSERRSERLFYLSSLAAQGNLADEDDLSDLQSKPCAHRNLSQSCIFGKTNTHSPIVPSSLKTGSKVGHHTGVSFLVEKFLWNPAC